MKLLRTNARIVIMVAAFASISLQSGCLPYTVGNTAQPIRRGEKTFTSSIYVVPNGISIVDSTSQMLRGMDLEARMGISDKADVGVRLASMSGLVINYKQRLSGYAHPDSGALSWMLGAGVVGLAGHAHFEATLLASRPQRGYVMPYGGLKMMHIEPMSASAWHDPPTIGAFLGIRLGDSRDAFLPEVAVYYDEPTGGLRNTNIVVVPSISFRGDWINRLLGGFLSRH